MKVIFIGAVEFSRRALEKLIEIGVDIAGVCMLEQSDINADYCDFSDICEANGIPWVYVSDINSKNSIQWIESKQPDIVFCFGWSRMLSEELLNLAPMGVIGFHPAALPANRGRHPLIWALVLGLENTASSFFFMDTEADNGDILSQREIIINTNDDARSLYDKVISTALEQIDDFVPQLSKGEYKRQKQDKKLSNSWRKRGFADGIIDWRMSANSIHNLVRGLSKPYVGAHFIMGDREVKVWKTAIVNNVPKNIESGKVLMLKDSGPIIKCGEDAIHLLFTEPSFEVTVGNYL